MAYPRRGIAWKGSYLQRFWGMPQSCQQLPRYSITTAVVHVWYPHRLQEVHDEIYVERATSLRDVLAGPPQEFLAWGRHLYRE